MRSYAAASVLGIGLLAGCGVGPLGSDEPDVDVAGTWLLVSGRTADGRFDVTPDTHVSLTFDDAGLGGQGACNDYGADYDLDGSSFDIPGPGIDQTLMGCGEEPEALDRSYFAALMGVDTVARDGVTLAMTGDDVEIEFRRQDPWPRAAIGEHRWRLASWTDESGARHRPEWNPGLRPFIRLGHGGSAIRVSASSGCRVLEGRWRMWRGAPHPTREKWRGTCPERLMDQEVAVNSALSEPILTVDRRAGRTLLVIDYAHDNSPAQLAFRR